MLRQISQDATVNGDAVSVKVLRKAMDIQSEQALALIEAAAQVAPQAGQGPGQLIDTFA